MSPARMPPPTVRPRRRPRPAGDDPARDDAQGRGLSAHILPTSATMTGVCMAVLSLGRLGSGGPWQLLGDKLLALDALVFLASAGLSFLSIRSPRAGARHERRAEAVFVVGLALLAGIALAVAFEIT